MDEDKTTTNDGTDEAQDDEVTSAPAGDMPAGDDAAADGTDAAPAGDMPAGDDAAGADDAEGEEGEETPAA